MKAKAAPRPSNRNEVDEKKEFPAVDDRIPRGAYPGYDLLPETLRHMMIGYLSHDTKDSTKYALLGKQPITLCLSQHADLKLGSCWRFGCLSPGDKWEVTSGVRVEKHYLIKDYESCLDYLGRENSPYCPISIEVLVFQVDVSSQDVLSTLDDLEYTLTMIQGHLKRLRHVVFAIGKHTFCGFSLKDFVDDATRVAGTVDLLCALKQILDDLRTCWKINHSLSTLTLLDYYILNDAKSESSAYLSNFAIALNHTHDKTFIDAVSPVLKSNKLKRIYSLETLDDFVHIQSEVLNLCHVVYLNAPVVGENDSREFENRLKHAFCYEKNPFIERIIVNCKHRFDQINISLPRSPFVNITPCSALIELTLNGAGNILDLSQLNSDSFPHLAHLCVNGGMITGHLNSQSVPNLKTFILDSRCGSLDEPRPKIVPLIREHTQSLICSGLPWQLVATEKPGGWSLASFDDSIANSQEDGKEDVSQSRPFIRELLLVMATQQHATDWQHLLNGNPSPEAAAKGQIVPLFLWSRDRVQKIIAFSTLKTFAHLQFKAVNPKSKRILSCLTGYGIRLTAIGAAMPCLRSLELNGGEAVLSGSFPQLQVLSFDEGRFIQPWKIDTPLLETLKCQILLDGQNLSLHLKELPHLSYLQINPYGNYSRTSPNIFFDGDNLGLSQVKHVVLGEGMVDRSSFAKWQVHRVSHLEVTGKLWELKECWKKAEWQCETLTVHAYGLNSGGAALLNDELSAIELPLLPKVRKLTVTKRNCRVLLNREMPELIDCTVPSPEFLGPNLKCPLLRCIRFTGKLSESEKEKCLERVTYDAIGAEPIWVYFDESGEAKKMSWDMAAGVADVSSFAEPLEGVD